MTDQVKELSKKYIFSDGSEITQSNIDESKFDIQKIAEGKYHVLLDNKSYDASLLDVDHQNNTFSFRINGQTVNLKVKDEFAQLIEKMGMNASQTNNIKHLKAPMPGLVLDIIVAEGSEIKEGDSLIILEAMKMENVLKSPRDGKIKSISVQKTDKVEKNAILMEFE